LFLGSVRVPKEVGLGKAKITFSFPDWKGGTVQETTYELSVVDPEPDSKAVEVVQEAKGRIILKGHTQMINSIAVTMDGKILASADNDGDIRIWDIATGKKLVALKGHSQPVRSVAFAVNGRTLASGSDDKTVKLWDLATGKELQTLEGHSNWLGAVTFDPSGSLLASGGMDGAIILWDAASGRQRAALKPNPKDSLHVTDLAFAPDGKTLAAARALKDSGVVSLWERCEHRLIYHLALSWPWRFHLTVRLWPREAGKADREKSNYGTSQQEKKRPRSMGIQVLFLPWPSPRTARPWLPRVMTARSNYGMLRPAALREHWRAIRSSYARSGLVAVEKSWLPGVGIRRCGCGR
jgi:WD40 repeat protein